MTNYATVNDLVLRYGEMTDDEASKAEILLTDASAIIMQNGGVENPTDDVQIAAYKAVCCAMVHRVMEMSDVEAMGATQHSQTAGPFTSMYTFPTPNGGLRLFPSEMKTLGLGSMKIGSIAPMYRQVEP